MSNNKDPDITLPLSELVKLILGDSHSHPIQKWLAEIIDIKCKDTYICAVEWPSEYRPELRQPLLWVYSVWMNTTERWQRLAAKSKAEKLLRDIEEANIRLVARQCKIYFDCEDKWATEMAIHLVRKKQSAKLEHIGIIKLIEREDEL